VFYSFRSGRLGEMLLLHSLLGNVGHGAVKDGVG
jgi:hypothetical protein